MIDVLKCRGAWIFVCGMRQVIRKAPPVKVAASKSTHKSSKAAKIPPPPETNYRFSRCWTGDRWDTPSSVAMKFFSQQAADSYLAAHRERIESKL